MQTWILFIMLMPWGSSNSVSITTQEFNSQVQCEYVKDVIIKRGSSYRAVDAFCVVK